MLKIAIKLSENRDIIGFATERNAEVQSEFKGWTLVDNDPTFSIYQSYLWTVRESDNKLVHKSTGKTPDEETKTSLAELTKGQLKGQLMDEQFQQAVTAITKQAIQDKLTAQMAVTELTKQVADLTIKLDEANRVDPTPEAPTDVASTATDDGATVTAK